MEHPCEGMGRVLEWEFSEEKPEDASGPRNSFKGTPIVRHNVRTRDRKISKPVQNIKRIIFCGT